MSMNDDIHHWLDGEPASGTGSEAAPEKRPAEVDEWERMIAAFRTTRPHAPAPAWLEQKVMAEIDALPAASVLDRLLAWLVRPATVRVPPLAAGLAAAALATVLLLPTRGTTPPPGGGVVDGGGAVESVVYVQFMLEAPGASSVAVAGDFSEWEPEHVLEDLDGDGVWTGRIPVEPGVHSYMFLIDGSEWQTDPRADRYQDDGFGNRNAVLAVTAGA